MYSIYSITCHATGLQYIGSTGDTINRWSGHKSTLGKGSHRNKRLQADYDIHGLSSLEFQVLQTGIKDRVEAKMLEQQTIDGLPDCYNAKRAISKTGKPRISRHYPLGAWHSDTPCIPGKVKGPWTVDGVTWFRTLRDLSNALGGGKEGARNPNLRSKWG